MRVVRFNLVLFMALASHPLLAADEIYTYVNEQGRRVYSNLESAVAPAQPSNLVTSPKPNLPPASVPTHLDDVIENLSRKHEIEKFQIDSNLVRAIIRVESNFNPYAVSHKGARGLMQLMPETARSLGVRNWYDPVQNIDGGIRHLLSLLETFNGDLDLALAAYNAGPNAVERYKRTIPPYRETRAYVQKVNRLYVRTSQSKATRDKDATYLVIDENGKIFFTNIDPPPNAVLFHGELPVRLARSASGTSTGSSN